MKTRWLIMTLSAAQFHHLTIKPHVETAIKFSDCSGSFILSHYMTYATQGLSNNPYPEPKQPSLS